ncbi:MAG: AAA family ATPase [Phycisphaeraceae bacterium]
MCPQRHDSHDMDAHPSWLDEPHDPPQTSPLRHALSLMRGRYHWAVLLAILLGVAGAMAGSGYIEPLYRSSAKIRIMPEARQVLYDTDVTDPIPQYDAYIDAQINFMLSAPVIERALEHEAWQRLERETPMIEFRNNVLIDHSRRTQIVEIHYHDDDPQAAAAGAEALIETYRALYQDRQRSDDGRIQTALEARLEMLRGELTQLNGRKQEVVGSHGAEGLRQRYSLKLADLSRVDQLMRQAQLQVDNMRDRAAARPDQLAEMSPEQLAARHPEMHELLNERENLRRYMMRQLRVGLGPNHRQIAQARVELAAVNDRIDQLTEALRTGQLPLNDFNPEGQDALGLGPYASVEHVQARLDDLVEVRERLEAEATGFAQQLEQLADVEGEIADARQRLVEAQTRLERLQLEAPQVTRIELIEGPRVPASPYNTGRQAQLTMLGGAGGVGLGLGAILLLGVMDSRLRHVGQAQLDLPQARLLGVLPSLPDDLDDPEQATIAAHSIHHIRAMLQLNVPPPPDAARVLTITSPAAGSGKTSLTTALGLSFATSGERTLLIDGDLVGAGLSRRLGAANHPSLEHVLLRERMVDARQLEIARGDARAADRPVEDVLVERGQLQPHQVEHARARQRERRLGILDACAGTPLSDVTAATGVDNLELLPVGSARAEQAGLLSPESIRRLLEQVRGHYDCVIIDTGPSLGSIEASMTAAQADAAILVVSRGDHKPAIVGSLEHLQNVGAHVAGLVFNHASAQDMARSDYASSISGSLSRSAQPVAVQALSPDMAARLGAVGSAVACCSDTETSLNQNHTSHGNGHGERAG